MRETPSATSPWRGMELGKARQGGGGGVRENEMKKNEDWQKIEGVF